MNQQLQLPLVTEETSNKSSVTNSVTEARTVKIPESNSGITSSKIKHLTRFCRRDDPTPFVEEYKSGGSKNQRYFRLSWRDNLRIKHLHIPGGNIHSPLAEYRAKKIRELCFRGAELEEIIAAVETYRGTKPTE